MGAGLPKQYLPLTHRTVLHHALQPLVEAPFVSRVWVVLAATDELFHQYDWRAFGTRLVPLRCGGATRAASVLNGLNALKDDVEADDWVLVHDAARPCLGQVALDRLRTEVGNDAVGGLLALPVADTLKRADAAGRVVQTESRADLWAAQTPQMFRYRLLVEALALAGTAAGVTDEASAIERAGRHPKLVMGDGRNLKVTYPQDLALAELILRAGLERS
jgi:2-C-methyl-D-erythritol 4-phosphate cytidylyltransferase